MAFDDYVAEKGIEVFRRPRKCWTCKLPQALKAEIHELRQRTPPIPYPRLVEYLHEQHALNFSTGALQKHFENGHGL